MPLACLKNPMTRFTIFKRVETLKPFNVHHLLSVACVISLLSHRLPCIPHTVCGLRGMTLILELMSPREEQMIEWVGVWVTHLWGFYASIAVKLNMHFSLISLWFIYHSAVFPSFTVDTLSLWSPSLHGAYACFIKAGCQLLAASRLTSLYLAPSCKIHIRNHLR